MSAFLLVFNRKGNTLQEKCLNTMMEKLNHPGIDGYNSLFLKNLFISHHHFWITPEEYEEQQPLKNNSGNLYISFDGRIDNRDEIIDLIDSNN